MKKERGTVVIVRHISTATTVEWGNGLSRRLLLASDAMGYTVTDTIVSAGTASLLEYRHHLEACYCVEGTGTVTDDHGNVHRIVPGTLYALDQHDRHVLAADPGVDLRLVCVFSPALQGAEVHRWDGAEASCY